MESGVDNDRQWFALFTATNNEKQVERHLQRREIEAFLPLYTVTKCWKNRTTAKVELPLFSGYVFARFSRSERWRVLDIPMVYSIVGGKRGSLAIHDTEIAALRDETITGRMEPSNPITVGRRARIREGALAGWEGVVARADGKLRVVLTVESILRSFAVNVLGEEIDLLADEAVDANRCFSGLYGEACHRQAIRSACELSIQ